jgi:hypothetical protein
MGLVSQGQLTALRKIAYQGLEFRAIILRSIQVETAFGSEAVWATLDTDVPCWVRFTGLTQNLGQAAFREVMVGTLRMHFEIDRDIEIADRLVVDGSELDVIDMNVENTYKIFKTALGKKVE